MKSILDTAIDRALQAVGFSESLKSNLFLIDQQGEVLPAYYRTIIRRSGGIRLGGGIGLYFPRFESIWELSLSPEEIRHDSTLPMIMLIENFMELVNVGALEPANDLADLTDRCSDVYDVCRKLPSSFEDFIIVLRNTKMLNMNISDYFHIFDYFDDNNLYLKKSIVFIRWFEKTWPQLAADMSRCLTPSQRQRVDTVIE